MGEATPNGELARWRGRMEGRMDEQAGRFDRVQGIVEATRTELSEVKVTVGQQGTKLDDIAADVTEVKGEMSKVAAVAGTKGMSWADRISIGVAAMALTGGIIVAIITTSGTP